MVRKIVILLLTFMVSFGAFAAKLPSVPYKAPDLPVDPGEELPLGNALWVLLVFMLFYTAYRIYPLLKRK